MATYPIVSRPTFSYADHLMYNQYVGDVREGIYRAATVVGGAQVASAALIAKTIERNSSFLADTVGTEVGRLRGDIDALAGDVRFGLEQVSDGISGLRADFDVCMGNVLLQFEMLRKDVQAGLARVAELLQNRRKVDADEHFRDAMRLYTEGCKHPDKPLWMSDAKKHFEESVSLFEMNPLAHLHLGHIYHYHKPCQDFDKAIEAYERCFTYAEAEKSDHPIAAQGYFYAGWLNAVAKGDVQAGIKLTSLAMRFDPSMSEALYHLAKFAATEGNAEDACQHLRTLITTIDRRYAEKAMRDPDFDQVRTPVTKMLEGLRDASRAKYDEMLASLLRKPFEGKGRSWWRWTSEVREFWERLDSAKAPSTYYELEDGCAGLVSQQAVQNDLLKVLEAMDTVQGLIGDVEGAIAKAKEVWADLGSTIELDEDMQEMVTLAKRRLEEAGTAIESGKREKLAEALKFIGRGKASVKAAAERATMVTREYRNIKREERRSSSQCFIATSAYGTAEAWEVVELQRFRDRVLKKYHVGRTLVRVYCLVSPPLARALSRCRVLRWIVRKVISPVAAALRGLR